MKTDLSTEFNRIIRISSFIEFKRKIYMILIYMSKTVNVFLNVASIEFVVLVSVSALVGNNYLS